MKRAQVSRFGFIMEQTLGHVTHYANLRATVDADPCVRADWYPLSFEPRGPVEWLPLLRSNWSARASWRAWRTLLRNEAASRSDALFFHTQVTTLLSARLMRRVPSVISLDATPINYDSVGTAYGHRPGGGPAERIKYSLNAHSLHAAGALVTWCEWAKRSLVDDYGVAAAKVSVIAPGVNLALWPQPASRDRSGPVKILFVGGDFARKGGEVLLKAFAGLENCPELHLVTKGTIGSDPGIFVYNDLAPSSGILRDLYATADVFVLPSLADCFPLVTQEAMAAGLPVVATDVGAIGEAVRHGETGLLVPPGDVGALRTALDSLILDANRRREMGMRGRVVAERLYDSAANAKRILQLMNSCAGARNR